MTPVTILHEAESELWEAVAYYEQQAPGLGLDFQTAVEHSLYTIREFPESWPLRDDGTRRCLTNRFPYLIVYTYSRDHIWLIAVAHCKRQPGYWRQRYQ